MKKLIISADDFGLAREVNEGIIKSVKNGVVTSLCLMVTREGFQDALTFIRKNPGIPIALHLDLKPFFNIEKGTGKILGFEDKSIPIYEILSEVKRQVEIFRKNGLKAGHFDSHYFLHLLPALFPQILKLMKSMGFKSTVFSEQFYREYYPGVKFDWLEQTLYKYGLKKPDNFINGWSFGILDEIQDGITELLTHPAFIKDGYESSDWRYAEYEICIDRDTREYISEKGLVLTNYNELTNN